MTDCTHFAADIASAFQTLFDLGGWNCLLFVGAGYFMGVLPSLMDRYYDWRDARRYKA